MSHQENLSLWPRHLYCPICGGLATRIEAGATGVKYRCGLCTLTYRVPAAQAKKVKVGRALELARKRLEVIA